MTRLTSRVLLVGSVPLTTVEQVFETCSRGVGDLVASLPDGEVGDREDYNTFLAYRVLDGHPDLETLARPSMLKGKRAHWHVSDLDTDTWRFKIKDDVKYPRFGNLHYADFAIDSYRAFHRLRDLGRIPPKLRFQVSLPPPHSAVGMWFRDPDDYNRVTASYLDALILELDKIVRFIPARDLAIQWDACGETLDIENAMPWTPKSDPWLRFSSGLLPLSMGIPEQALLGYHFCYGDIDSKHELEPESLDVAVRMANLAANNSGRRVDWVHMPVPRGRDDDDYFEPLEQLAIGDTKLFLGLVHAADALGGAQSRVAAAKGFADDFGIAGPCGLGRTDPDAIEDLLALHAEVAELLPHPERTP